MATPQYTIKTGADSSAYFSREFTASDVDQESEELGRIKIADTNSSDVYEYPVLVRRTGDSLKGTTESIESNEFRKGRTKSAPRKGNSSSEGSLDFELSPETYDDILEAAFRNEWREFKGDQYSATNLDDEKVSAGYILSKTGDRKDVTDLGARNFKEKRLWASKAEAAQISKAIKAVDPNAKPEDYPEYPLIVTPDENFETHELSCGTKDIRYSILKHFGGVEGDDLYQEFEHNSVDTVSLEVTPGQIVTGSFGFMGSNNPEIVQKGAGFKKAEKWEKGVTYYVADDTVPEKYSVAETQPTSQEELDGGEFFIEPTGLIKKLSDFGTHKGRFDMDTNLGDGNFAGKTPDEVENWIGELPDKGTSTDQYTAREGFLYINGERVRYGSTLSFELSNGLEKTFAIFEKDAIATSPLTLDVTGSLGAYLIKGYSEKLYQLAVNDKDVEVVFCFQDKDNDDYAENLYVVQIFKTKFTGTDLSSGAENLEVTFPFQSFEERACRIFRIRRVKPMTVAMADASTINVELSTNKDEAAVAKDFEVLVNGTPAVVDSAVTESGYAPAVKFDAETTYYLKKNDGTYVEAETQPTSQKTLNDDNFYIAVENKKYVLTLAEAIDKEATVKVTYNNMSKQVNFDPEGPAPVPTYSVADPQPTEENFGDKTYYTKSGDEYEVASVFDQDTADSNGYYVKD